MILVVVPSASEHGRLRVVFKNPARLVKSLLGLLLVSAAVWALCRYVILTHSTDALVVTDFIDVAAPIDGFVHYQAAPEAGATFAPRQRLARLENPRVDKTVVADLQSRLRVLDGSIRSLEAMVQVFDTLGGRFESRGNVYQRERARQLEAQVQQVRARIEGDQARLVEAQSHLQRMEKMADQGLDSLVHLDETRRDARVAEQTVSERQHELEALLANADALKRGFSVGDLSAMDRSYSGQRQDEIALRLVQLRGELEQKRAERPALAEQFELAEAQFQALSAADLAVDGASRLWSINTADGVFVSRGAPLMRLVDCSHLRVLAYLPSWQYDRIKVGDRAAIDLDKRRFEGHVTLRLGSPESRLSVAGALTVPPDQRQRYAVVVSSPDLASELGGRCDVGDNVDVRFLATP
jgi:hypothetical protein